MATTLLRCRNKGLAVCIAKPLFGLVSSLVAIVIASVASSVLVISVILLICLILRQVYGTNSFIIDYCTYLEG